MRPFFEKRIFWDINFDQLDLDEQSEYVIGRVFERGDVEDIRACRRYYGDSKIEETLMMISFLPYHRIFLAAAIINRDISELRCYTHRQSNPELYPY